MDRAQRRRHPIAAGRGRVRSLPSGAGIPFEEIEEPRSHKLNAIAYPSLDGLTAKGATEEQRSPDSKRPTPRGRPKCLFQLVAGVRNWSWQHRKNNSLWCPSRSIWAIASCAGRSRSRKRRQIPALLPIAGDQFTPQLPAAISEPNDRCLSLGTPLWPGEAALRQVMDTRRRRESEVTERPANDRLQRTVPTRRR